MMRILLLVLVAISEATQLGVQLPPTIIKSPRAEIVFRRDDRIELECEGSGVGTLDYSWKKNDANLELNDFAHLDVENAGAKISIKTAAPFDEGYYQCIVSSTFGVAVSNTTRLLRASLSEPGPKTIHEVTAIEGQPFAIYAQPIKSFPRPTYSWEIATDIEDSAPQKLILKDRLQMDDAGNLYFGYATTSDAQGGKIYKLVTFNQYLDQKQGGSYTRVTVKPSSGPVQQFRPIIAFPSLVTNTGVVGRNISLRCFFSANPPAKYQWRGPNGNPLDVVRAGPQLEGTELLIRDIQLKDQGNYDCTATNIVGSQTQTIQMIVQEAPVFRQPGDHPRNVNATVGDSVNFTCNADGNPTPSVMWFMNGKPLTKNTLQTRMRFTNNEKTLIIDHVCKACSDQQRSTDLMVIQCNASNTHGYVLGTGYLNVLEKTVVMSLSNDVVEVRRDEPGSVTFQCSVASSDPSTPVSIKWFKAKKDGDEPVDQSMVGNDSLTITVGANNTEDWLRLIGDYKCSANNGYSNDFKIMSLTVENMLIETPAALRTASLADIRWIFIIAAVVLLMLILLLACCVYLQRSKGDTYPVDEKERMNHNDPERELQDGDFQEYTRPESRPLKGSRGSLGSTAKLNSDDEDDDAMSNEYGDVDPGKFTEDGSFVGVYTNNTVERNNKEKY